MKGFALLVTGDEQLSGKRRDQHLAKVIELLSARGLALSAAAYVGDDEPRIAAAIRFHAARGDILLCTGGIGATPDDRTRQAAAAAFGVQIERHRQAEALIVARYGDKAFPHRVLMADFPVGAQLIPNPVNDVAGFSFGDCHFVPGFPEMAWPMLEWVLDTRYAALHRADPPIERGLRAVGTTAEGDLLPLMQALLAQFPGVTLSSLPCRGDSQRPRHIEFGIKGPRAQVEPALSWLRERLREVPGVQVQDLA